MRLSIAVLSLSTTLFAQSPANILGMGNETDPSDGPSRGMGEAGEALRSDRSWDPRLEARSAFATQTALEVQLDPSIDMISDDQTSNSVGGGGLPRVSLSIPMGRFGHLGMGYWQRFDKSFEWTSPTDSSVEAIGQGGAFEGDLSYGYALPWLRGLALGVTYHRILGEDRLVRNESWQAADEGLPAVFSDTLGNSYWGSYWTGSVYFTRGPLDLGAWADLRGQATKTPYDGGTSQQFEQPQPSTMELPRSAGFAAAYRFSERQAVVADLEWTTWQATVSGATDRWKGGVGWQSQGAGDRFDDFWKRASWRAGAYGIVGGDQYDLTEAATLGLGFPLGMQGAVDLSLHLGQNEVDNGGPKLKDTFVQLYVVLSGASSWGESLRSHK